MSRKILLLLVICILMVSSAQATIPLALEQSFQLPPCTAWDVQHWMSRDDYGYAFLRSDTVFYAFHTFDTLRTFVLTDTGTFTNIKLLKLGRNGEDAGVAIIRIGPECEDCWPITRDHYLHLVNLSRGVVLSNNWLDDEFDGGHWFRQNWEIGLTPWPPPPARTVWFLLGDEVYESNYFGDFYYVSSFSSRTIGVRLTSDGLSFSSLADRGCISVFPQYDRLSFLASGTSAEEDGPRYHCEVRISLHDGERTVSTFVVPPGLCDPAWQISALAQLDADGTPHIITDYGSAYDASSFYRLWAWPIPYYWPYHLLIARVDNSGNDRILHHQGLQVDVFDALNGQQINSTTSVVGTTTAVIKAPGLADRLLTWEDSTRTIRIYRSSLCTDGLTGLTCSFLQEGRMLQLHWSTVSGAIRYWIYASSTADGQYWPIDHVNAGATSYDISPASPQRFFQVTAEYDH